jgi:hypothetical protein
MIFEALGISWNDISLSSKALNLGCILPYGLMTAYASGKVAST